MISQPQRLSRRLFLKRGVAVIVLGGGATGLYAWRIEPHWIRVVRRNMPIVNLPGGLVGKTLAHVSDLHIGPVVDERYMCGAMELVSSLGADIIAITGDFMTYTGEHDIQSVGRVLRHLRPGRLATVGVLGNHDFGSGWNDPTVADRLTATVEDRGIAMLRNRVIDVQGLRIGGVDDLWSSCFAPQRVMPNMIGDRATIMLCHNPDAADLPVWTARGQPFRGWMLSGHTHGGQCRLPFCGPPRIPVKNKRYTAGEIDLGDGRRMYINSGLGYLKRVRFCVRPEVTVFTLQAAETLSTA